MQADGEVDVMAKQQNVVRGRSQDFTVDLDAISWVLVDDRYGQQLEVISLILQVHASSLARFNVMHYLPIYSPLCCVDCGILSVSALLMGLCGRL